MGCEGLRDRAAQRINLDAYHELKALREYEEHFEVVGYFDAYSQNALQTFLPHGDQHGRIPAGHWRRFLKRQHTIACEILARTQLTEDDLIAFIGKQCEWWNNARRVGPSNLADEYKRNIQSSIELLRSAARIDWQEIVQRVGRCTSHCRPTLEVIFPDWTEEQRDLTIRSLKGWADEAMSDLPNPFPVSEADLSDFCDWLEARGLYQYYWHFRRLVELQNRGDPVHHSASAAEVVGLATLCELIANEVMIDRGIPPRGTTLAPKLRKIFGLSGPVDLNENLQLRHNTGLPFSFGQLANTGNQTLLQRLKQIRSVKAGGPHNPVLRIMLSFMAIRNEGIHLGLLQFDHIRMMEMIRILSVASLMLWKAR